MLLTLTDAKEYITTRVGDLTGKAINETEKRLLEALLEDAFFEKLEEIVDEDQIEELKLESDEELEGFLFHKVPNYTTILEETTAEVLADYLEVEEVNELN